MHLIDKLEPFYVVLCGVVPGLYSDAEEALKSVTNVPGSDI